MTDFNATWKRLLQDVELAVNYQLPYAMFGFGRTFRNPIIEDILPSSLFIQLVSLVDDAMDQYIDSHGIQWPPKSKQDLNGRIKLLTDAKALHDANQLHALRNRRNELAHEANPSKVDWKELRRAISTVEAELLVLKLINGSPTYSFYYERSGMRERIDNTGCEQDYSFGLKEFGNCVVKVEWTERIDRINPPSPG